MTQQQHPPLTHEAVEEARRLIGVELRRHPRWTVAGKELILRFGLAIGTRNPLYTEEQVMATDLWGTLLAHPTMLYCFDDTLVAPKLPGIHSIYAGTDWEFYNPVLLNDRITASARLLEVEEKEGQFCGPMALQKGEVLYKNQLGEEVAKATSHVMRTPRGPALQRRKYMEVTRHRYTPEDMETIDKSYEGEVIRGDVPRYWEEVQEGEELTPVVKGPLTSDDMLNFIDMVRGTLTFSYFLEHRRKHPADVYWDPETGMPDSWDASMTKEAVAQAFGFPFCHDAGIDRICWLETLVTNWTSNLGFLERLSVRLLRPNFVYDTTWCRGRVTGKTMEGDKHRVELAIWAENQRGERTATGTAVVALVSREVEVFPPFIRFPAGRPSPVSS